MASPWSTPPSTPSSPGVQPHSSNKEESPVSFEQPPEGAHLQSYTKVRTRGSLKRRPPSRRFRKSQSDMDFDVEASNTAAKENGDKSDEADAALRDKEDGDTSPVVENSPSESSEKTLENQNSNQEDPAKPEETSGEEGEKSTEEEEKQCPNQTKTPATEEETIEEKNKDSGEEQDKEESNEQNKSDGDDKPEK